MSNKEYGNNTEGKLEEQTEYDEIYVKNGNVSTKNVLCKNVLIQKCQ